jgi:protein-L-isoaspartate(D-aspartate) O-methyltransferase
MTNLTEAKREIRAFYQARTNYDNDLTRDRALRLFKLVQLQPGQHILDVATGTGIIAIAAAEIVGTQGKVIAVDFTPGMLAQARTKIAAAGWENIELIETDVDNLDFPKGSFEVIFCSFAIVLLRDIPGKLKSWYRFLKPGGMLLFTCHSETSYFTPIIRKVCAKYGITLPNLHEPVGTPEKCYNLMEQAGFTEIEITTEQLGKYMSLEEAKNFWKGTWLHPEGHPLSQLQSEEIEQLQGEYQREIETLVTDKGVWHDITTFFVRGRKI